MTKRIAERIIEWQKKEIAELRGIIEANSARMIEAREAIEQRDRLLSHAKNLTKYLDDLENRISNEEWTRHQKEEIRDIRQLQQEHEKLIREIESGK